jgi:hypothetical protein
MGIVSGALPHHQRVTWTNGAKTKAKFGRIDQFFVTMLYLTSGSTFKLIGVNPRILPSLVNRYIANCLQAIEEPLFIVGDSSSRIARGFRFEW